MAIAVFPDSLFGGNKMSFRSIFFVSAEKSLRQTVFLVFFLPRKIFPNLARNKPFLSRWQQLYKLQPEYNKGGERKILLRYLSISSRKVHPYPFPQKNIFFPPRKFRFSFQTRTTLFLSNVLSLSPGQPHKCSFDPRKKKAKRAGRPPPLHYTLLPLVFLKMRAAAARQGSRGPILT